LHIKNSPISYFITIPLILRVAAYKTAQHPELTLMPSEDNPI
jgi:hypothetical protein